VSGNGASGEGAQLQKKESFQWGPVDDRAGSYLRGLDSEERKDKTCGNKP